MYERNIDERQADLDEREREAYDELAIEEQLGDEAGDDPSRWDDPMDSIDVKRAP